MPDLLTKIDGREVQLASAKVKLDLAGASIERLDPDWRNRLLALLSNPTLAVVLLMIGIYGLFVEFTSPGFGVPGVAGAIALLLGALRAAAAAGQLGGRRRCCCWARR